ncbi:MAG: glycosyltransferase family 87 protein, partial [Acidimicrobiia bacterium]
AGALVAVVLFGVFFAREAPKSLDGTALPDFPNYYFGGERLFDGRPVYGSLEADVAERFGVSGYEAYPADPPPTVVLVAPLSLLPYNAAWLLLAGVSIVILLSITYLTAREMGYRPEFAAALAGGALLTTSFRFLVTRNHIESLVLLVGFLGWRALRRGGSKTAGLFWGLATALKLFPGMWLVGLTRRQSRIGVATGAGTVLVAGLLSLAVLGWSNVADFFTVVIGSSTRWYGALGNYSLLSLGTALSSVTLGWVFAGIGVAILVPIYVKLAAHPDQVWVAGTAVALLLSPLSWLNYLVLAIPALIIVGSRLDVRVATDRWLLFGLVASLGFWGPVVLATKLPSILVSFVPTYGLVALFVVAITRLGDRREAEVPGV